MKDERGVVSNVDTFAQWTQTDFNINIILPESQDPIKITANPSSISRGESCNVFLTYGLEDNTLDVTGNLKQVIHTGNAMSEVVLTPNNYKRCFPIDWIKNETRPSGIKMLGDSINGISLRFSGTPISDDTINIPQLINKFVVSLPTDLSTKHYNWDNSVQETDKYFLNSMRVTITADDGYKFATNMEYSNVTITPTTMTQYLTMTRLSDNKLEFSLKDKSELDLTKLSDVQIDIPACDRSTYRVEIALGPHMTNSGGELIQNVVIGQPITQINLAVIDGMTFMPNIHNYSKDGITINVDTSTGVPYTKAWVSGTPLRDTQITVRDVVKGAKFNVVLPSDGSVLVKAGEEAKLNQFIESGEYIDGVTLVPKDANYKMTQDWRKTIAVEPANDHIMMMTSDTETYISGRISENTVITVPALIGGGIVLHSDTFSGLTSYEGRWWTEWQLSNVSGGAVIKYIRNILTETGPKNVVLYTDETSDNSYFTNIPYGLSERFTIQFNETKKIPMIWIYSETEKGYYADLDYDMFCIDIGEDSYNNMSKPCTVRYWSRPYWYTLSLPASGVVNGDPVKLTLTCYGNTTMFDSNKAVIGIDPSLTSSLQVHTVTPFVGVSSNTYEATIKFTGTRDYTFSEDIVYVIHLDEVATVGIQLSYSGSV